MDSFSRQEQKNVYQLALEKNEKTSKLTEKEVLNYKQPCPLLKDGSCTVYPARPLACRIYLSMKVDSCYQFYMHPNRYRQLPGPA